MILQNDFELLRKPVSSFCQRHFKLTVTFLLFRARILTLNSKTLINMKYHMFVIINISSNLQQTLSSFLKNNSKCYATKKWKKVATSEISQCDIIKNDIIEKYYYLTKSNNSSNNLKSSKISKCVTENMSVSLNRHQQNMGQEISGKCLNSME